jgi:putative transposase
MECQIVEGHLIVDHAHMRITIPPKRSVASVIGFLKGKSAMAIARLQDKERNLAKGRAHRPIFLAHDQPFW